MKNSKEEKVLDWLFDHIDEESVAKTRNRMLVALKIEQAMRNKGLSQKQFSEKMGRSKSEISDWLSGERNFTIDMLTEIERFLKIRIIDTTFMECSTKTKVENWINIEQYGSCSSETMLDSSSGYRPSINNIKKKAA